jgi:hypothetical protein
MARLISAASLQHPPGRSGGYGNVYQIIPSLAVDPFQKKENDSLRVKEDCAPQGGI